MKNVIDSSPSLKKAFFINLIKRTVHSIFPDIKAKTLVVMNEIYLEEVFEQYFDVDFVKVDQPVKEIQRYRQVIIFLCAEKKDDPREFVKNNIKRLNKGNGLLLISVNPASEWKKVIDSEQYKNLLNRELILSISRKHLDMIKGVLYISPDTRDEAFTFKNEVNKRKQSVPGLFFSKWSISEE